LRILRPDEDDEIHALTWFEKYADQEVSYTDCISITLMVQKVLAQPHWQGKLTPRDYAALTPLIWEHVNPYGRFDLDMNARLALL
jgi:hypothetical protein